MKRVLFLPQRILRRHMSARSCSAIWVGLPAEFTYVLLLNMDERRIDEVPEKLLSKLFYCL